MAQEVFTAREASANPINAARSSQPRQRGAILYNNGSGKTGFLTQSADKGKNEVMKYIQDHVYVRGASDNASVDDLVRVNNGSYEVKIWNTTGSGWNDWYGTIVPHRNNTGRVLAIKKQRGRWTGTLTERGNYGQPDRVTKVF